MYPMSEPNKMINASEMSKPFTVSVNNSHRLKSSKDYTSSRESRYSHLSNAIKSKVLRVIYVGKRELYASEKQIQRDQHLLQSILNNSKTIDND